MTTDQPTDADAPTVEEVVVPDHGPDGALFDETDLPPIEEAELEKLLGIFCSGWISGFVSSALTAARQHQAISDDLEDAYAHAVEHHAQHVMDSLLDDPIARHQVVTGLRRRLAGEATRGLLTISCNHEHSDGHEHGEECGS